MSRMRLGLRRHALPDAQLGQGLLGGEGDGGGPAVIGGALALDRRLGIHQQHLQPRPAEGDGRGHADHAAAHDEQICLDIEFVFDVDVGGL